VVEFLKENQVEFEEQLKLNMGQALSIPLILTGIIIMAWSIKSSLIKIGAMSRLSCNLILSSPLKTQF